MEVRFTPHIGWVSDFSWNFVDGPQTTSGWSAGVEFRVLSHSGNRLLRAASGITDAAFFLYVQLSDGFRTAELLIEFSGSKF